MINFILTNHAKQRMSERNITIEDIEAAIRYGDVALKFGDDKRPLLNYMHHRTGIRIAMCPHNFTIVTVTKHEADYKAQKVITDRGVFSINEATLNRTNQNGTSLRKIAEVINSSRMDDWKVEPDLFWSFYDPRCKTAIVIRKSDKLITKITSR